MLTVLIDDLRDFRDGRDAVVLRTSPHALDYLRELDQPIDELWLDHDLGGDDTIRPVVLYLEERAFNDERVDVGEILVHTANPVGAAAMVAGLQRYGYNAKRIGVDELISGSASDARRPAG